MKNLVEIYCFVDNFVKFINSKDTKNLAGRKSILTKIEFITLAIFKQEYGFKTTKKLYEFIKNYMPRDFPNLPSYLQFNDRIKNTFRYVIEIWRWFL